MMQGTYASPTYGLERLTGRNITYGSECNESEFDFYVVEKVDRMFLKNVIVITGALQHNLVVVDVVKQARQKKTEWKPYECMVKEITSNDNHD